MLDVLFARWNDFGFWFLSFTIIIPAKILILSGAYGILTELISGEEIVLNFKRFKINVKKYWKVFLALNSVLMIIHGLLFFSLPNFSNINYETFATSFNIFVLFTFAFITVNDKYREYYNWKISGGHYSIAILASLTGVYFTQLAFYHIPHFINFGPIDLSRILWIFQPYITFLLYIMIVHIILEQYPNLSKHFTSDKEIYLINPAGGGLAYHIGSLFLRMYPSIFVVIKALTPKNYTFRFFNRIPWNNRYFAPGKLVAITCFTSNCPDAYRIARGFKKSGSTVVMGGPHVSYLPEEALEFCDCVVIGEVESVWPTIMNDYEQGTLKNIYRGVATDDCHEMIQHELLNSPPEIIKDVLETTRGCKFKCKFCAVPSISSGKIRRKHIGNLVALINKIKPKYKHVLFIDNNIYNDPAYAKELFTALKPLKIHWSTQCTIDIAQNDAMLKLAKESGCKSLLIGFEITEGSFEKNQGGKLSMANKYIQYAKKIRKMGINIKAHFIFGFESDKFLSLFRFWKFCFSIKAWATVLSILTPFPGTKLYDEMIEKDQIANLNWRNYGAQSLVFRHPTMNNFVLRHVWPAICLMFMLSTSKVGYPLVFIIAMIFLGIF